MSREREYTDPRGPRRTIIVADNSRSDHWLLTLDCGHVAHGTRHMWFDVGRPMHCLQCRRESESVR